MVIRLSPTMQKRVERAAKARGVKPSKLVEELLTERLVAERKPREQVSEARKRLRELAKYKKKVDDFDAELHEARRYARQLEEDNAEFIEAAARRYAKPEGSRAT